jgi:hypothetical protein
MQCKHNSQSVNFKGLRQMSLNRLHLSFILAILSNTTYGRIIQGSSYFEVERASSLNGNYVVIGQIPTDGIGEQNYKFTDPRPTNGSYYRIRTVAENREPAYSTALKVQFGDNRFSLEKLFPTVSQGQLNLVINNPKTESVTIEIVDMNGRNHSRESKQLSGGSNQYQLKTSHLPNGS